MAGAHHGVERALKRDPGGAVIEEAHFRDGVLHGAFRVFDPSGRLIREAVFVAGELDGMDVTFDELGGVAIEISWRQGRRHGIMRRFENGALQLEAPYSHDRLEGEMRIYGENGVLAALIPHVGGVRHGVMELFGPDGRRLKAVSYVDGVLDGEAADFKPEGEVAQRQTFRRGAKIEIVPGPADAISASHDADDEEERLVAAFRASFFDRL